MAPDEELFGEFEFYDLESHQTRKIAIFTSQIDELVAKVNARPDLIEKIDAYNSAVDMLLDLGVAKGPGLPEYASDIMDLFGAVPENQRNVVVAQVVSEVHRRVKRRA